MPKAAAKKTKSAPKAGIGTNRKRFFSSRQTWNKSKLWLLSSGLLLFVALVSLFFVTIQPNFTDVKIGRLNYKLQTVKTEAALEKGLGGRSSLPANQGMLFVFSGEATRCFWMKDMQFPLDMIWLNGAKQVVAIKQSVLPSTYPMSFCPRSPAQYVIELNDGQVKTDNLKVGETLHF